MRYCYSKSYVLKSWSPGNISTHDAYHSSAHWGFFNLAFSSIDLALISCPDFSSKRDMSNHRGIALGHFFSCTTKFVYRDKICNVHVYVMCLTKTCNFHKHSDFDWGEVNILKQWHDLLLDCKLLLPILCCCSAPQFVLSSSTAIINIHMYITYT